MNTAQQVMDAIEARVPAPQDCDCDYSIEGDRWDVHVSRGKCARCRALEEAKS